MMPTIRVTDNFAEVKVDSHRRQNTRRRAVREALNRTTELARDEVVREMARVFDRPVPFTLKALRVYYASTASLRTTLWFRQRSAEIDKPWAVPQIAGGGRGMKPMEQRLQRMGLLPSGWFVVPGEAAPLDRYGNMSQGEISRILNVLGTYMEAGYNKANSKTVERLRKGKKAQYGFAYWVNKVGAKRGGHLLPGVYRRVYTPFGTSLKPMMIFVQRAKYRKRLDFFGIVNRVVAKRYPLEFDKAVRSLEQTGSASGLRRAGDAS